MMGCDPQFKKLYFNQEKICLLQGLITLILPTS